MTNWFANKLAPPASAPRRTVAPATQGNNPWWMVDTGRNPSLQTTPDVVYPDQAEQEYAPRQARSIKESGVCPNCDSGNYIRPQNMPNAQKRCYDCGYPILQQFSGAGIPASLGGEVEGSAKQLPANHVMTQVDNGRGSLATGNHTAITSASEAIGHA